MPCKIQHNVVDSYGNMQFCFNLSMWSGFLRH